MKKTTLLRKSLSEPGVLVVPAVYDCLSARIVEAIGFKSAILASSMTGDAQFGLPPIGLPTATEVVNLAGYIADAVEIPLIVEAEDGFGGALAAYRATREFIKKGIAGIVISDRKHTMLVRAPHNLVEVLPIEEYLGKMGAIIEARNKEDRDFVVIARIDAGAVIGDEEAIARAKACVKLGVDIIQPQTPPAQATFKEKDKEGLRQLYKAMDAPETAIWGMGPPGFTAKDCEEIGAKMWVPKYSPRSAVVQALAGVYQEVYDTGDYKPQPGTLGAEISKKMRGSAAWREMENKFVPQ
jgi:methylisocitrate lyase